MTDDLRPIPLADASALVAVLVGILWLIRPRKHRPKRFDRLHDDGPVE